MDYEAKLQLAHKELNDKGVWKSNYNPPIAKWLRKLGMCFPPPYYQSYFANVMLCVTFFAPVWGIFQWFFVWNELGKPVLEAVFISLLAGTLFGLVMATFYYIRRKQLNLTDWGSLGE
ncbi:DUF6404 family protein [Vibrio vulnificus]|uniref:DUF6404 family protein n=1 Tax=Vibrio aestuarianus TaxID=28171 RepID=A0A9X4J263_9VIBR|nr:MULTISPECIES: DUF6404 family protein [Vibrio]EIO3971440.1 hypothetical protein [Vibrio vulnificus]HDZ9127057.1 hypothetical protein [Vibrio cholerae]MBD1567419.1 hypothetical protein [Vibrio sp. S12_S33]MDE1222587.1 DUF6404 family protein [Vibrio aestuarianus]MDE1233298.1 DUF6404 family protein [Vibrio aestuarianus]